MERKKSSKSRNQTQDCSNMHSSVFFCSPPPYCVCVVDVMVSRQLRLYNTEWQEDVCFFNKFITWKTGGDLQIAHRGTCSLQVLSWKLKIVRTSLYV